jgi:PhnB protein
MKDVVTYLNFDGNCREALEFYAKCLGSEVTLMPFSEGPRDLPAAAKEAGQRIMHGRLTKGKTILMASDCVPGMNFQPGNNFSISLECESMDEIEKLFAALGENGKVTMPLQDMFWGARFGMITDQFGVNWMLNFELPKPQ